MNDRTARDLIADARDHAVRAHRLADGLSLSMTEIDDEHALRSYLIIVGEACSQVPDSIRTANPDIPWSSMRGLRNRLVHAYWRIDLEMLHRAAREHAPVLVAQLDELAVRLEAR